MTGRSDKRIGFISTRFMGTDGVSLETSKWVKMLEELGHKCYYFAGESDLPEDITYIVSEAHFMNPEIDSIQQDLFDDYIRSPKTTRKVHSLRSHLKKHLAEFKKSFDLDLVIIENALSIPMNVPLGLAITEFLAESSIPAIGHHHDFSWERSRFDVHAASDFLRGAFPPVLPTLNHVVINSAAKQELARRAGASSMLIPNVMDFEHPPADPDDYANDMREELGISPEDYLILQPTRIVPRKRIEQAIELIRKIGPETVLVITHAAGDEGYTYKNYLQEYAEVMDVRVIFASDRFSYHRGETKSGEKIYSLADAYQNADLVTYPSSVEGFGNAFLETIYYKQPIFMGMYSIYRIDIQPKGFSVIKSGNVLEDNTVKHVREILSSPRLKEDMVNKNFKIAKRFYSFEVLRNNLTTLLNETLGA
jgi:glycosyltransferase involved in cell wall biosynthesis